MKNTMLKMGIALLITAVFMSGLGMGVYSAYAKPKFFAQFMDTGNKYLSEEKYEEAILEFNKAIQINGKSPAPRVGVGKGYIGLGEIEPASFVFKIAQDLDITNEELLLELIDLIKDFDPETAYEMLLKYIDAVGLENISAAIRALLDSSKELPMLPNAEPLPGVYVKPFPVRFVSEKVRIGHTFYYTLDDSEPTNTSSQYRAPIDVDSYLVIKLIGYNPAGDYTEAAVFEYQLDESILPELEAVIADARATYDNTEVGVEVGNCVEGAKEALAPLLEDCEMLVEKPILGYDEANDAFNWLTEALYEFREQIIVPTEREALRAEVEKATQLISGTSEGNNVGQYRTGAKAKFQGVLDESTAILEGLLSRQVQIDDAKARLSAAITSFNASKITEIDKIIMSTGAKVGKVTVSLLWNTVDDVDLHVTSPRGDIVYHGNQHSFSGGRLDVDRQVMSYVDNPVENIYWDSPPSGRYTVRVNVYSKRTTGSIPIKVRVIINGEAKIYELSISSGMNDICSFTY